MHKFIAGDRVMVESDWAPAPNGLHRNGLVFIDGKYYGIGTIVFDDNGTLVVNFDNLKGWSSRRYGNTKSNNKNGFWRVPMSRAIPFYSENADAEEEL